MNIYMYARVCGECHMLQYVWCVALCGGVLQCVEVCCHSSVLQLVFPRQGLPWKFGGAS